MISCQQLTELVTDYVEGRMSLWDRVRFRLHLAMCPVCVTYVDQLEVTVATLGRLPDVPLDSQIQGELLEAFRAWRVAGPPESR